MGNVLETGIKVLVGVAAGVAVVFGLNKLGESKQYQNNPRPPQNPPQSQGGTEINGSQEVTVPEGQQGPDVIGQVRIVHDFCSRVTGVLSSVVVMAESIGRAFGKEQPVLGYNQYYSQPWNGGGGGHPFNVGGRTWTRQSPNVVEAPPMNGNYYGNYPV